MKTGKFAAALLVGLIVLCAPNPALADLLRGLKNYVAILEGSKKAESLTPEEAQEVLSIHNRLEGLSSGTQSRGSSTSKGYEIEISHNDELFIINGETFEAKTYCFGFEQGDRVIFVEGSPFGACASAKLLNTRNSKVCEVWCE